MWRSVLLGFVLAGLVAGCSLDGGSGADSGSPSKVGPPGTPSVNVGKDPRPIRADPHACVRRHHLPADRDLPATGDADIRIGPDSGDSQSAPTGRR